MAADRERYQRQTVLPEIGEKGQEKLHHARILVVGAGGLGSPALYYLAAAGVGTLGICDGDTVEISNLNRQILHGPASFGVSKVDSAAEQLLRFNPELEILRMPFRLTEGNVHDRITGWDLVLDCTDTLEARLLISDACYQKGIPLIEAGISGWEGLVYPVLERGGPCYRCLYPASPGPLGPQPAIGALCGTVGAWMALEALRYILGTAGPAGTLFRFNGLTGRMQSIRWPARTSCTLCGKA